MSPLMVGAAIAIILFCSVGVAAMMGWIPVSSGQPSPAISAQTVTPPAAPVPAYDTSMASAPPPVVPQGDAAQQYMQAPAPVVNGVAPAPAIGPGALACSDCGVIESVREVSVHRRPSGVGLIGGALVGGLLGNAIGGGRGRALTTVGGAAGGAYVGNQIEKNHDSGTGFAVVVRMDDGRKHTLHYGRMPQWREGDRVRYEHGHVESAA
jgi:outer membrane lipoprotein SlyB